MSCSTQRPRAVRSTSAQAIGEKLSEVARSLISCPLDSAREIDSILAAIGAMFALDRVTLLEYGGSEVGLTVFSVWSQTGIGPRRSIRVEEAFPWGGARLRAGHVVELSRLEELPAEAAVDRESFRALGVRSHLSLPLRFGEELVGSLAMSTRNLERDWSDTRVPELQLIADLLAGHLARVKAFDELREKEHRLRAFVQNSMEQMWCMELTEPIPLDLPEEKAIDRLYASARIVEANPAFARQYGFETFEEMGSWTPARFMPMDIPQTRETIRAIVRAGYEMRGVESREIDRHGQLRLIINTLTPQIENGSLVRIYGTARDVTEERGREVELDGVTHQLAVLSRQATASELTAAIAHELNQPLAAILANAQAAKRFLQEPNPDLGEIEEILVDIVGDDRRASQVLERLRALFTAGEVRREEVDINQLVGEVAVLLHSQAILQTVIVELDLGDSLPAVLCDRIQIEQVLMNLVLNGFDAMQNAESEERRLIVETRSVADGVRVAVRDNGVGFEGADPKELFTAFYSKKEGGLGIGLSISRSIVQAHDGRIWAAENRKGGATFVFSLPTEF